MSGVSSDLVGSEGLQVRFNLKLGIFNMLDCLGPIFQCV